MSWLCTGSLDLFGHGAGGFDDSSRDFWVRAQVYGGGGTEVGEFVDYIESVVANFDSRGLADILGIHIGFLKANSKAKVFTCAGEFVDEPLHCYLRVCFQGSIVIEKECHKQEQFWLWSWHWGEPRWRSLSSVRVWRYIPSVEASKAQDKREEKKIPKSVGAKTQPCFTLLSIGKESEVDPLKDTMPLMLSCYETIIVRSLGTDLFYSQGQTPWYKC